MKITSSSAFKAAGGGKGDFLISTRLFTHSKVCVSDLTGRNNQHVMIFHRSRLEVCLLLQSPCDDSVFELRVTPWLKFQRCGPLYVHCQGLSLSLHLLCKHPTLIFITAESFGFALVERLTGILLLTTNKSHVLGVPISNFRGPAQ